MKYRKLITALALSAALCGTAFLAVRAAEGDSSNPPGVQESKKDDSEVTFKPDKDANVTFYDWKRIRSRFDLPDIEPEWEKESSKGMHRCLLLWNPSHKDADLDNVWYCNSDGFNYMDNDTGKWSAGREIKYVDGSIDPDIDGFSTYNPLTPLVMQKSGVDAEDSAGKPSAYFLGLVADESKEPTSYTTGRKRPIMDWDQGEVKDNTLTGNTQVYRNLRILYASSAFNKWNQLLQIINWTTYYTWGYEEQDGRAIFSENREGGWSGHSWAKVDDIYESHLFKREDKKGIDGEDSWIIFTKDTADNFAGIKDEDDVKLCSKRLSVAGPFGLQNGWNDEAWLVHSKEKNRTYTLMSYWDDYKDGNDQNGFRMFLGTAKTYPALTEDYTVRTNCTFRIDEGCVIPENVTLTIEEGGCLIVGGNLMNSGKIINNGSIVIKDKGVIQPFLGKSYEEDVSPTKWNHGSLDLNKGSSLLVMRGGKLVCGEYLRSMLRLNSTTIDNYGYIVTNSMEAFASKIICEEKSKIYVGWERKNMSRVLNNENVDFSSVSTLRSGGLKESYLMEGCPGTIKSWVFSRYSLFRKSRGAYGTFFAHGYLRVDSEDKAQQTLFQGRGSYTGIDDGIVMGDGSKFHLSTALWGDNKLDEKDISKASKVQAFRYVKPGTAK